MTAVGSILGALLPEPERSAVVRRLGGDPPRASGLLGILQFVFGAGFVYDSAMSHLRAAADRVASEFLALAERSAAVTSEQALGFTWSGAVLWLGWLTEPTSLLLVSVPLVGLLRLAAWLTVREAVAEPAVWAATRLVGLARFGLERGRTRAEFGAADAPDEASPTAEGDGWVVLTARPRPEWTDAATIGIGEGFYRIVEIDQVVTAGRRRHRYRLAPAPEHDVIRRYLRYELPQGRR